MEPVFVDRVWSLPSLFTFVVRVKSASLVTELLSFVTVGSVFFVADDTTEHEDNYLLSNVSLPSCSTRVFVNNVTTA